MARLVETNLCLVFAMDCKRIDLMDDRDKSVLCALLTRELPPALRIDMSKLRDRLPRVINILDEALWPGQNAFRVAWLCEGYTNDEGRFPCGVLLGALSTIEWLRYSCFRVSDLLQDCSASIVTARQMFVSLVLERLRRF